MHRARIMAFMLMFASPTFADPPAALEAMHVKSLLALIQPSEGEDPFTTIPWLTNLWEARKQAVKEGKPILLWEMDGHPLGCG